MDDLLSDEDASSPTVIGEDYEDTIYKGVMPALHPTRKKSSI